MVIHFIKSILIRVLPERSLFYLIGIYDNLFSFFLRCLRNKYVPKFITNILRTIGIELIPFENIVNFALTQPQDVDYIFNKKIDLYYSPPCFDQSGLKTLIIKDEDGSNQYAAKLKQAGIIGGSNLLITNTGKALYDTKYHDKKKKYRYTDGAIIFTDDEYCLANFKQSHISFESAIFIGGNFSLNYYHLLFEILVKFEQIELMGLSNEVPILVDKICLQIPQYKELFDMMNKAKRKIIEIDNQKLYLVNNLYHISCPNLIPPNFIDNKNIRADDVLFDLSSLNYLRSNLLEFSKPNNFPKRIFLSRRKVSRRRSFNEKEVINVFEKYGFVIVFTEDYSVAEQISMFNNADFIAGGSGAAFSNLLFCKNGCKVICFTNYAFDISVFSTIAKYVGADMLYISDDSKNIEKIMDLHESFIINLKRLDTLLTQLLYKQ